MAAIGLLLTAVLATPAYAQSQPAHHACYPPPCPVQAGSGTATTAPAPATAPPEAGTTSRAPASVVAAGLLMVSVMLTGICLRRRSDLVRRRPAVQVPSIADGGGNVHVATADRVTTGARTP